MSVSSHESEAYSLVQEAAQHSRVDQLVAGDVVSFADITELVAFEDAVARVVDPNHNSDAWASRPHLRDLIRPPRFNGTIADINLTVMADPYERLLDAPERGWVYQPNGGRIGRSNTLGPDIAEFLSSRYVGLSLTADARSSRRGSIGQIQAELWYAPFSSYINGQIRRASGLRRIVTRPRVETERFIDVYTASRRVAFTQLREAMAHPMRG